MYFIDRLLQPNEKGFNHNEEENELIFELERKFGFETKKFGPRLNYLPDHFSTDASAGKCLSLLNDSLSPSILIFENLGGIKMLFPVLVLCLRSESITRDGLTLVWKQMLMLISELSHVAPKLVEDLFAKHEGGESLKYLFREAGKRNLLDKGFLTAVFHLLSTTTLASQQKLQ